MTSYICIIRYPYEEPYHLNLVMSVSNGSASGVLEFYIGADTLIEWAFAYEKFPRHAQSVYLWEAGSERPEDRFAYYLRMQLFTTDAWGHSALQIRFNNNQDLPDREIVDMCIRAEPAQINQLGALFKRFSTLEHQVLYWSGSEGQLFETIEQAEQCVPAYALRRGSPFISVNVQV
ncbi:hypothetical protein H8K38_06965 [Undibacterium sp. FT79W]|uniref:hypothetical protein n=1 Tax=Undibacterium sp. FT79W TaxID=2762296 RepID=UPI00164C2A91|nr:hypothetical protein [Undibacterium sp. FT79W]MBC3877541.1 hypothetical protein [Undibacterium sp. FT79W]